MNAKLILYGSLLCFLIISCDKKIELSPGLDSFDVTTEKDVYKVDEDVVFNFSGDPDMIAFYSGELYSEYAYKDERVVNLDKTVLNFTSMRPELQNAQVPDFQVLVSTDFNDTYTYENITNASWTDITSEFALGGTAYLPSGDYEISKLYEKGKPLYVAFRYKNKAQEIAGVVRRLLIQSFQMVGQSNWGSHLIGDPVSSDFRIIEKNADFKTATSLTNTTITLAGYSREKGSSDPDPETDTWTVTKAFDLDILDNGPDRPVALKGNQDPKMKSHIYNFKEPGEYLVTFIGINANINENKQVVRQLKIKVENPD